MGGCLVTGGVPCHAGLPLADHLCRYIGTTSCAHEEIPCPLPTHYLNRGHDSRPPDDGSATRRRVARSLAALREIGELSHSAAADVVRADGVDILVDLQGHTLGACVRAIAAAVAAFDNDDPWGAPAWG